MPVKTIKAPFSLKAALKKTIFKCIKNTISKLKNNWDIEDLIRLNTRASLTLYVCLLELCIVCKKNKSN